MSGEESNKMPKGWTQLEPMEKALTAKKIGAAIRELLPPGVTFCLILWGDDHSIARASAINQSVEADMLRHIAGEIDEENRRQVMRN